MSDPLPQVSYEDIYRAIKAIVVSKGTVLREAAIQAEFGLPQNARQAEAYNAIARRAVSLAYLIDNCKSQLKELGLTEYQLLNAAAFAQLDHAADGWEIHEIVTVAATFPRHP
jgi:hypothetical protein